MHKVQFYDIHASFLVPAYNLPEGILSHYITTQYGQHNFGNIVIDVWLVKASKENPTESMIASLNKEQINYQIDLEKQLAEEKPINDAEKSPKIRELEKGKTLFANLVAQAQDPVYRKQPDDEFLEIARNNFARLSISSCQPDLKNYLYLAGLSNYGER